MSSAYTTLLVRTEVTQLLAWREDEKAGAMCELSPKATGEHGDLPAVQYFGRRGRGGETFPSGNVLVTESSRAHVTFLIFFMKNIFSKIFPKKKKQVPESVSGADFILEIAKTVIIAIALVLVIRFFLIQPFYVKGASMEPNFFDHEYLVVNEIGYRLHTPNRGDVAVVRFPRDPSQFFIKRIIGLPGETVEIHQNEIVITSNGGAFILNESYLPATTYTSGDMRVTLSSDEFFVMGDNREASLDSRSFGPVNKKYVVGKAWVRVWPFDRFNVFDSVAYPSATP
ncbi:MAG: signal peptidase I [Patescibacteria group bacterium]